MNKGLQIKHLSCFNVYSVYISWAHNKTYWEMVWGFWEFAMCDLQHHPHCSCHLLTVDGSVSFRMAALEQNKVQCENTAGCVLLSSRVTVRAACCASLQNRFTLPHLISSLQHGCVEDCMCAAWIYARNICFERISPDLLHYYLFI